MCPPSNYSSYLHGHTDDVWATSSRMLCTLGLDTLQIVRCSRFVPHKFLGVRSHILPIGLTERWFGEVFSKLRRCTWDGCRFEAFLALPTQRICARYQKVGRPTHSLKVASPLFRGTSVYHPVIIYHTNIVEKRIKTLGSLINGYDGGEASHINSDTKRTPESGGSRSAQSTSWAKLRLASIN